MMTAGLFGTELSGDVAGQRGTGRPILGLRLFKKVAEGKGKTD